MKRSRNRKILGFVALVLIVVFGFSAQYISPFDEWFTVERVKEEMERFRNTDQAWAIFTFVFAAVSCVALPVTPLMLAAAYLFGFMWGAFYNWLAANVAAWSAYGVARFLGGDALESLMKRRLVRFRESGFRTTLYLRLIPIFPFAGVNFGAGAARVSFRDYMFATLFGMIPSAISFTLFADATLKLGEDPRRIDHWALFFASIGLLAAGAYVPFWLKRQGRLRVEDLTVSADPAVVPPEAPAPEPPAPLPHELVEHENPE